MAKEYIIYHDKPEYCYGGGQRFNAYPTHGRPWRELVDLLPASICHYDLIMADNKPAAVKEAKRRWANSESIEVTVAAGVRFPTEREDLGLDDPR